MQIKSTSGAFAVIHGHRGGSHQKRSRTYNSWRTMRERCTNVNHRAYFNYGGRGIMVCERWRTFAVFLDDMGERPEGKTLDRIDANGPYCKDNCKWSDVYEQNNNTRRQYANRKTYNSEA